VHGVRAGPRVDAVAVHRVVEPAADVDVQVDAGVTFTFVRLIVG
jgi:hypothetical protein